MAEPLRIGLISPVWFPVPPTGYGGIEWVVWLLANGLAEAGHDVTLFASGDSHTKAKLVSVYDVAPSDLIGTSIVELHHALACFERAADFDVVNDHSGPPAAALGGAVRTPVVHTVHGPLDSIGGVVYEQIARVAPQVGLISISLNQRKPRPNLPWVANCPNALDFSLYPVKPHRGDYLLFLGRMSPQKGCHRAIDVAISAGLPLKIAGKRREREEEEYFDAYVRPFLSDQIEYLGEVTHGEKVELLQDARATLFPIEWEEPFGLVMIESMACGTPVIATRYGAVPEVIEHGRSGIIVDTHREMVAAIEEADRLDPLDLRAYCEERFSPERMVADYLAAYRAAVERGAGAGDTGEQPHPGHTK
ncbi:MAG TPA: glycosyltransferase family 4 protein [Gaiellaceae bacterium]|nr:glycosyltransferase family 4 protein [Gaiellaceae bacterium]